MIDPVPEPWALERVADPSRGRAEVEALFALVGEATAWQYPPQERLATLGSLAAWVWISPSAPRWEARTVAPSPTQAGAARGQLLGTIQLQLLADDHAVGLLDPSVLAYWSELARLVRAAGAAPAGSPVSRPGVDALAVVERLVVHPDHRRQGIASALLEAAITHARGLGRTPLLTVLADSAPAVALYRRHGAVMLTTQRGLSGREVLAFAFPYRSQSS